MKNTNRASYSRRYPWARGVLDLPRVIQVLRAARPGIRFNLEMITRDPLKVPCLSEGYWATFPDLPGKELARIFKIVRGHAPARPLPRISQLPRGEQIRMEDENVRRCLDFATIALACRSEVFVRSFQHECRRELDCRDSSRQFEYPQRSTTMPRPRVYFDVTIDGKPAGCITMELYNDVVPETAENFPLCARMRRGSVTRDLRSTASSRGS